MISSSRYLGWDYTLRIFSPGHIADVVREIRAFDYGRTDPFRTTQAVAIEWESVYWVRYLEDAGLA